MLYLAIILFGVFLYAAGNFLFGKKRHGGKRLILLVAGLFAIGMAVLLGCISIAQRDEGAGLFFVVFLFLFGLVALVVGIWLVIRSFSADAKTIEKTFDSLTDSF